MRKFIYFIIFLTIILIGSQFLIPYYYNVPVRKNAGPLIDKRLKTTYQIHIENDQPELVLIGDSTLAESIDQEYLTELLGIETYKIGNHGSASAVWYLILRNNIAVSAYKPKHIVLFFRTSILTTPEFRTTGKYEIFINEAATPDDTLMLEYAYLNHMNSFEKWFDQYVTPYAYRSKVRSSIENVIKYQALQKVLGVDRGEIIVAMDTVFGEADIAQLSAMITSADSYLLEDQRLDFNAQLNKSFLPEIIRISQENNIQLTLVYTKTVNSNETEETRALLKSYMANLTQYLSQNNVEFMDYSNDERVLDSFFVDPLHMNADGRHLFTEIFAQDYTEILRP